MTAALTQQTIPVKDPSAIRKRRRRAPAGGAADDCFACAKKNIKCDRRRPYCSQCLEVGSECSGYKTQLTWGVGVASRGKLRGLSLPIAKAPPVAREQPVRKTPVSRSRSGSNVNNQWSEPENMRRHVPRGPIDIPIVTQAASAPTTPYNMMGYDYLSVSQPENTPPFHQGSWSSVGYSPGGYSPSIIHSPDVAPKYNNKFGLPLVTEGLSSSVDSLSEVDYMSPMSQSYQREDFPYTNSPHLMYDSYSTGQGSPGPQSPPPSLYLDPSRTTAPTSCPSLVYAPSEACSSIHSNMDTFDQQFDPKLIRDCNTLRVPEAGVYRKSGSSTSQSWASPRSREDSFKLQYSDSATSQWPTTSGSQSTHVSPDLVSRMPFFMDYYENVMCPSMVFIDGPHNPFRHHILHLAASSQSIQHAICALAACNLRMKRKLGLGRDTRELSAELRAEKHTAEAIADAQPQDKFLAEEYQHRNLAVHLLNQQLNNTVTSTHDSVLATILLLCHYRMVESGIAKFHTQFAGVNKILSLRSQQSTQSGDSVWMEALFTYFDAISASINDREGQLNSSFVNFGAEGQILPVGAENHVGCDRELFKTISKLGRLNLLSQSRSVNPTSLARSASPLNSPLGHAYKDATNMNNVHDQHTDASDVPATSAYSSETYEDSRSTFWHEWKEARVALQSWQFDAARVAASLPGSPSQSQLENLHSLSEAFRYAALLYMERLAGPSLPSSHSSLQSLVNQVIYYVAALEPGSSAEKFLLWPLFVAGSEAVDEAQQQIIRSKCRDIMTRSGYMNNLAALDALEKIWANGWIDGEQNGSGAAGNRRGAFSWTQCIGGPGVEVEWIMF